MTNRPSNLTHPWRWIILTAITICIPLALWLQLPHTSSSSVGSPSWSPDSKRIAYYDEHDGLSELFLIHADGSNPTRLTTSANDSYPNFSPDGRRIAFDSKRDGNYEIFTINTDGSNLTQLTRTDSRNVSPSWSPDGKRIAFMSDCTGDFEIWLINADGTNPTQLTHSGSAWFPRFSPDGSKLAFHLARDIHILNLSDSHLTRLTTDPANGMYPDWSPDGRQIVYMSWRDGPTEIYVMDADGTRQHRLTHTTQGDCIDPRWSPNGSKIVYVYLPNGRAADGPKFLRTMNPDGTSIKQIR